MTKEFFKKKPNQHLYNVLSPRGETFEIDDKIDWRGERINKLLKVKK